MEQCVLFENSDSADYNLDDKTIFSEHYTESEINVREIY